ncbi:unnamed protein product [Parajaminaea phylloscopi]
MSQPSRREEGASHRPLPQGSHPHRSHIANGEAGRSHSGTSRVPDRPAAYGPVVADASIPTIPSASSYPSPPHGRRLDTHMSSEDIADAGEESHCDDDSDIDTGSSMIRAYAVSSPIVEPDTARFPASLLSVSADTSSGSSRSGRSSRSIASATDGAPNRSLYSSLNGSSSGLGSESASSHSQSRYMPARIVLARRQGEASSSPDDASEPSLHRSNGDGRQQPKPQRDCRDFPPDFIAEVLRCLVVDSVHRLVSGLPESALQRHDESAHRYSFLAQLNWMGNYRLVNRRWRDLFDKEPLPSHIHLASAFPSTTLPTSDLPNQTLNAALRELKGKCIACILNEQQGDVFGQHGQHVIFTHRLFGRINLCWLHARDWASATQANPQLLVCHLCLMEGHRKGQPNFLAGNILPNEDPKAGKQVAAICESCRASNFDYSWAIFPACVPRRYRAAVKDTRAYSLFTRHGHGSADSAVHEAHDELEDLMQSAISVCRCQICQRQKRKRESTT